MRADVLEILYEELAEREAHPLASFRTMEDGRPRLTGMRTGRGSDLDRDFDQAERQHDRKMKVEVARLRKMRARHKKPELYRVTGARYEAEHKAQRRQQRLARYRKNHARELAKLKAYRERNRDKLNAANLARHHANRDARLAYQRAYYLRRYKPEGKRRCSICHQPGHNRVRCGRR